jgi:hypothetical protein
MDMQLYIKISILKFTYNPTDRLILQQAYSYPLKFVSIGARLEYSLDGNNNNKEHFQHLL